MVDTALEVECSNCGELFWYSGEKNHPETVECSNCNDKVELPEDA